LAFATFSFGGYGLAVAALALMDFGAIECPPLMLQRIFFPRFVENPFLKLGFD